MKKKILSVLMAVVMLVGLLPAGIAEAANTLPNTVTAIATNTTVSGSMEESEYGYRFDLASDGYITISYTHPAVSDGSWNVYLWNSTLSTVHKLSVSATDAVGVTSSKIGLPAGRYYLVIRGTACSDGAAFSFRVNYTASGEWETEMNNTQATADPISAGDSIRGSLMTASDKDVYSFDAQAGMGIRLSLEHGFTGTEDTVWIVTVTPTNGASGWSYSFGGNVQDIVSAGILGYASGTCFITVQAGEAWSDSDYRLILEVLDGRWESEPNDDERQATPIGLGDVVWGSGSDGTVDYFRLTSGVCGVTFHLSGAAAQLIGPQTSVRIYDGMTYGLGVGEWYLQVQGGDEYRLELENAGPYEQEMNSDPSLANELPIGATIRGNTYDGSEDYYHISPSGPMGVQITGAVGYIFDPNSGLRCPIQGDTVIGLKGGNYNDYYICVQGPDEYTLGVTPVSGDWEQEYNNDLYNATPISLLQTLYGSVTYDGDEDYYVFDYSDEEGLLLQLDHEVITQGAGSWTVELVGPYANFTQTFPVKESGHVMLGGLGLEAGRYYIHVTGSNVTGQKYTLSLATDGTLWERENNDNTTYATRIEPGQTRKGHLRTGSDVDVFELLLTDPGVLTLNFTHPDLGPDEVSHAYWRVSLISGSTILYSRTYYGGGTGGDWDPIGLRAGTYAVVVESCSSTYHSNGIYQLTPNFEAAIDWEEEDNGPGGVACCIPLDFPVHGTYSYDGDTDVYSIHLSQDMGIFPVFTHDVKEDATARWTVTLSDMQGNTLRTWSYSAGEASYETDEGVGLPAGDYLLKVTGNDVSVQSGLVYTLTAKPDPAPWEKERNNVHGDASPLAPNTTTKGSLMKASDVDWYCFEAEESGVLRLDFTHPDLGPNANGSAYWRVTLYDAGGSEALKVWAWSGVGTGGTWGPIGLKAGTWKILVEAVSSNYHSAGTYTLTANWEASDAWEEEINSDYARARELEPDTAVSGAIMYAGDDDYYSFTLDEAGGIFPLFSHEVQEGSGASWNVALRDSQHSTLRSWTYSAGEASYETDEGVGLSAGTYYLVVSGMDYASQSLLPYTLTLHPDDAVWEEESNNTKKNANELMPDLVGTTVIRGSLMTGSDVDYFKLKADKPGYLRIHFTHPDLGVDEANNSYWRVSLLDKEENTLASHVYTGKLTEDWAVWDEIGLAEDDWYIKVERYSSNCYSGGTYTLQTDWVTGIPFEQEWNNSFSTATEMQIHSLMPGSLMTSDDADYFHFTLEENSGLYLQLFHEQVADSAASWSLTLYNDQHNQILSRTFFEKDKADLIRDDGIGLPAGEYFAKVTSGIWTSHPYELQFDRSSAVWEQESNNTMETANTLKAGTDTKGSLATGSDVDYYELKLSRDGGVTLHFTHPDLGVDEANNSYWRVSLQDSDGNTLASHTYAGKGTGDVWSTIGLDAGTWYVAVERYSSSLHSKGIYTLRADVDTEGYWEQENNDTMDTATVLALNKTVSGSRMTGSDSDWYRLNVAENGFLTLCIGHDTVNTANTCWNFTLYDADGKIMTTVSPKGNSPSGLTTQSIGLTVGTYYVLVDSATTHSDAVYTLEAQFSTEGLWESEYNNTFGTADELPLSQTIHGNLMRGSDLDYYTFEITQPGYVELCFAHAAVGGTNTYWRATLCDAERNSIISYTYGGNETSSRSGGLGLPIGTYFVTVERYSSNYHSDFVYDLTADFHAAIDWEEESNDTRPTANLVEPNVPVHGSLMTGADKDYFFFEVGADDSVAMSLTHPYIDSTNVYWTATLYNESGKSLASLSGQGYKTGEVTGTAVAVSAGVYYVGVSCSSHSTLNYTLNVRTYGAALARINSHPEDVAVGYGQTARFTVSASGAGLKYQWEYSSNGGTTWRGTGANSATLARVANTANDGWLFRCSVTDSWGNTVVSNAARLTLAKAPIVITSQPEDVTARLDEQVFFHISATGDMLRYQWQYSVNGGATWRNTGGDSDYASCIASVATDARLYRCVVTDIYENSAVSAEARLTLEHAQLVITSEPEDMTGAVGDTASFTVAATGDDLIYQWYYSANGGSTWRTTGTNAPTLSRTVSAAMDGWLFRCTVTDAYDDSVTTRAALFTLVERSELVILSQPEDFTGPLNGTATFHVEADGDGLSYMWQSWSGTKWANTSFASSKSDTLTMSITAARDGRQYRCVVTDQYGKQAISEPATLHVEIVPPIEITSQPEDFTGALNGTATFRVAATGENLSYIWQTWSGTRWVNTSFASSRTDTLTMSITAARDGRQYRCVITDADGNEAISEPATLHVAAAPAIEITAQPEDFTGPLNGTATFTVIAAGENLSYIWQTWSGTRWVNTNFASSRTDTLTMSITAVRDGKQYRCVVTDADGNEAISEPATLHVAYGPVITGQPEDFTGPLNEFAAFTVVAAGEGLTYQWQSYSGGKWINNNFASSKSDTLSVKITTARNGAQYRCIVTDADGNEVISNPATLHVG